MRAAGKIDMQSYLSAIRNRVCVNCRYAIHGSDEQFFFCGLLDEKLCRIKQHLPEVIQIVDSFQRPSAENCLVSLRTLVCSNCTHFKCGQCPLTGVGDCTLDSQFHRVVEAIRDAGAHGFRE